MKNLLSFNQLKETILYTLLTALTYFVSAKLVTPLSLSESASIFAVWPPTGVALVFLLFKGSRVVLGIFLGAFLLNLTISTPSIALEIAVGNTLGPFIVYLLILTYLTEDLFYGTQSIISFIFFSSLGALITSGMGTYALYLNDLLSSKDQLLGMMVWFFGDLIGFLLITSLYYSFSLTRKYNTSLTHSILEIFLMLVLLFAISTVVFGSGFFFAYKYPIEYLILFPLLWASIRFKPGVNILFLFFITILAIIGTASGYSHFSFPDKKTSLILLQFFVFTVTFAVLLMTAQRHQMLRILAEKEELSMIDPLTHIGNRRSFISMLEHEHGINKRYKRPLSLIMFDIDFFKHINDQFGHQAGDDVLTGLTQLIKSELRISDNFARWGGEEFIILLPQNNLESAKTVAQKLQHSIENFTFNIPQKVTCSFGVIECGENETFNDMIKRVDDKLYEAKHNGRNCVAA